MRIDCKPIAALVATCLLAVHPLAALTASEARRTWADSTARELRGYLVSEVPGSELGDWPRSVDETLFMLFRRTELHRGRLQVRYTRSDAVVSRIFPDGTVVLSTGLLDHIDAALFDRMAASSRRVRSLEGEREEALLPFLAQLAAETALDFGFATSQEAREAGVGDAARRSVPDRFVADRMTMALLSLAGYETKSFTAFLRELARPGVPPALRDWASRFPPAQSRLAALESSSEAVSRLASELSSLISAAAVRADVRDILASAEMAISAAGDMPYLARLQALALHRSWLSSVTPEDAVMITHLPVASVEDGSSEPYAARAAGLSPARAEAFASGSSRAYSTASPVPGDARAFALALQSYARARETLVDGALDSAYARLLAFSPSLEARKEALSVALAAGESEDESDSPVARANLAALLYYSGTDRARGKTLAERHALPPADDAKPRAEANAAGSSVRSGYPCDARAISVNLAVMMKSSGEAKKADEYLARIRRLFADARSVPSAARASFRRLVPGDSVDGLVAFWGKPAGIAYSYYSEWWEYPSLKARVLVAKDPDGRETTRLVTLGAGSPVSPGGNVRVGDALADFEAEFGTGAYAVADGTAYLSGGLRMTVLAPYGTIRAISAGF